MTPYSIKRRDLILGLSTIGLASLFGKEIYNYLQINSFNTSSGARFLGGANKLFPGYITSEFYPHHFYKDSFIFIFNTTQNKFDIIPVKSQAHAVVPSPVDSNLLACSSRRSDRLFLYDQKLNRESAAVTSPSGLFYYGHSAFSNDGKQLIANVVNKNESHIHIYDTANLRLQNSIDLGKIKSHDILAIDQNQYLLAGSDSNSPTTVYFFIFNSSLGTFKNYSKKITEDESMLFSSSTPSSIEEAQDKVFVLIKNNIKIIEISFFVRFITFLSLQKIYGLLL